MDLYQMFVKCFRIEKCFITFCTFMWLDMFMKFVYVCIKQVLRWKTICTIIIRTAFISVVNSFMFIEKFFHKRFVFTMFTSKKNKNKINIISFVCQHTLKWNPYEKKSYEN